MSDALVPTSLHGEVVYIYAFDIAYEMTREPIRSLMGAPVAEFAVDASKRAPRQLFFYRPQIVRLPAVEKFWADGLLRLERSVKLLPLVGAISVTVRVPFEVARVEDLVKYHDPKFSDGQTLYDDVHDLAAEIQRQLQSENRLVRPAANLVHEEAYTAFCIEAPLVPTEQGKLAAADWFVAHRRAVASLLTEESNAARLSDQEAAESTGKSFSYYENDVVVIDWDAALVIDERRYFDETLYLIELANLQLAELEAYDRILDDAVETAYRDVGRKRLNAFSLASATQRNLREIRIDFARLQDELSNITKFFGDWHSARLYQGVAARFHLADWHRTIDEKLKTLDELYALLRHDQVNRWMLVLEVTIVVLFIFDIVKPLIGR